MGQRTTWVLMAVVILSAIGGTLMVHHRAQLDSRMPEVIPGGTAAQMPSARATAASSNAQANEQPSLDPATMTSEQRTVVCLDAHDPKTWEYYRCPGKFMAVPKDPLEHEGAVHVTPITP